MNDIRLLSYILRQMGQEPEAMIPRITLPKTEDRTAIRWLNDVEDKPHVALLFEDVDEPVLVHVHLWLTPYFWRHATPTDFCIMMHPPYPDIDYYVAWVPFNKRGVQRLLDQLGWKRTGRKVRDGVNIEFIFPIGEYNTNRLKKLWEFRKSRVTSRAS